MGSTCWLSLSDRMKAWLRVSRWACDCCRCAIASSKVIPAGSVPSCSPLPSPPLFLLFSPSWRRDLVALFNTSDLAWMLSWRPDRMDGEKQKEEKEGRDTGKQIKLSKRREREVHTLYTLISTLTCWEAGIIQSICAKVTIRNLCSLCVRSVCVCLCV